MFVRRQTNFLRLLLLSLVLAFGVSEARTARAQAVGEGVNVVREIRVEGNQRIEADTVRSYMLIRQGDQYAADYVDHSLKNLFATGLFADVTIRREGSVVTVTVVENPIVNRIALEGNSAIKNDKLLEETQLRPRVVYTRAKVQADVQRMVEIYRRSGRFAATIEPKVIQLPQNRVDVVFEISEGRKSEVRKINFIGNRDFSDGDLRDVIATKQARWWRFLTSNDTYDPDRMAFDRDQLRQFYLRRGYADFRVISSVAELTPDRERFYMTFTVDEGQIYRIGEVGIESQIRDLDEAELEPLIQNKPGKRYNAQEIDETIDALTEAAGIQGYAFVNIRPRIRRNRDEQVIDITYRILEAPRVYVERINITGNSRTLDRVIRREFKLLEGDAFNTAKMRRSRVRIRGLGFFEDVQVEQTEGSRPDRTVIDVSVQERATGELSIGAGVSSQESIVGEISIRERNLLGKGQDLRLRVSISNRRRQIDLGFTEPRFLGRNLAAGFDLFTRSTDFQREASFDERTAGFALRVGFPITEFLAMTARYSLRVDEITNISQFASPFVQAAAGSFTRSEFSYSLGIDKRNDPIKPTRGYSITAIQDFSGLGGNVRFLRSRAFFDWYTPLPILDSFIFNLSLEGGHILGLGQNVRLNDRFFLGSFQLRGFDQAGVGPRDARTLDALGGNTMYTGTAALLLPLGSLEEFGIRTSLFVDAGSLFNLDDTGQTILTSSSPRISTGVSFAWDSPFGPIRFDFAKAIKKEPFDETEFFQFNIGTSF